MPPTTPLLRQASDVLLSTDAAQRLRIGRSLMAAAVYVGCLGMLFGAVQFGLLGRRTAWGTSLFVISGPIVFYAALRSGWNQRTAEPALTLPQMLFAVAALILTYAVGVPFRSAILLILTQVMTFGMFSLSPAQARRLTACAIGGFGLAMTALATWRPEVYDPHLEIVHFILLAAALLVITTLSGQFARLRTRLRRQRAELRSALARLQRMVRLDELTGLVNRRCMQELLTAEQARRRLDPQPACLCAIDLDRFKRINDNFGHAAGDEVLRRFADVARRSLRSIDVLARWGGEEFLLLLPGTDPAQAVPVLERLREALADATTWQDRPQWRVTFSAGLTLWPDGEPPEPAIERADAAAYRAKAGGRDGWRLA